MSDSWSVSRLVARRLPAVYYQSPLVSLIKHTMAMSVAGLSIYALLPYSLLLLLTIRALIKHKIEGGHGKISITICKLDSSRTLGSERNVHSREDWRPRLDKMKVKGTRVSRTSNTIDTVGLPDPCLPLTQQASIQGLSKPSHYFADGTARHVN